jgi:hypothetical protein
MFFPACIFINKLLLGKMIVFPTHVGKALIEAAVGVFFLANGGAGTKLIQNIAKIGVVDGRFALYNRIVMIQDQAWIF